MSVETPVQPNYPSQVGSGTLYPTNIDKAIAALKQLGDQGAVYELATPAMNVNIKGLRYVSKTGTVVSILDQQSGVITAPVANPRIDTIILDLDTDAIDYVGGAESATPVPQALMPHQLPVAYISLAVGQTEITNSNITDRRQFIGGQLLWWLLNKSNIWTALQVITTGSPGKTLALAESGNPTTWLGVSNGTVENIFGVDSSGVGFVGTFTNHDLTIRTNNLEVMRIDTAGKMTVGSVPLQRLALAAGGAVFDSSDKMIAGNVPLARMRLAEPVAKNGSLVTLLSSSTNIVSVDCGTVNAGDHIIVNARALCAKGATGGRTNIDVVKFLGTSTIQTYDDFLALNGQDMNQPANSSWVAALNGGHIRVTAGGTLSLMLRGLSEGSNSSVAINQGQISALVLAG